jgi:hypothetical protein
LTPPAAPPRALLRALAAAVTLLAVAAPAQAKEPETSNFDARPQSAAATQPPGESARDALRARLGQFGALALDEHTGTLRSVGRLDGFLTGPSGRDGAAIALDYVRDHAGAFGLDGSDLDGLRLVNRDFVAGVEHLSWEQRYRGIPAADAGLQASVTGSGRLLTVTGPPAADLAVRSIEPAVPAAEAYAAARDSGGDPSPGAAVTQREGGAEQETRFGDGGHASLTLYRAGAGYRLAWRILAPVSSTGVYDVLIDARSAQPIRRANRVKFAVPANVFENNPDTAPQTTVFFENWLTSNTRLEGPNAHAFLDVHDVVGPGPNGYQLTPAANSDVAPVGGAYQFPLSAVSSFSVPFDDGCPDLATAMPTSACTWDPRTTPDNPDPAGRSWTVNKEQSATQLFYFVNTFHDHLKGDPDIRFDEGGFRTTPGKTLGNPNTGSPEDASDPVLAQALDGAATAAGNVPNDEHVNNANFLTLPDGYPGLMQMYLWKPPFGGYDGANDAATVFHEYTHGLSGRLVTDAGGYEALSSAQAGAMSEGWSDFYALDYLVATGRQTDAMGTADLRFGRYLDNASGTINATVQQLVRIQSIDCVAGSPSPSTACRSAPGAAGPGAFTYADFGKIDTGGVEFHADGEIWGQTLWSLRAALIGAHGSAAGIARARRYVTTAMRLSPPEPSFLDMRNAILQASTDEADDARMWTVFADRGMGYFASTQGGEDVAPLADFTNPATLTGRATLTGTVRDQDNRSVEDAHVEIGALGDEVVAETNPNGSYSLEVPVPTGGSHTYPTLRARKAAYAQDVHPNVPLGDGATIAEDFQLERDWSSAAGGATVASFSGPDHTDDGCGPGGLVDDDPGVVWGTSSTDGAQQITVDLGATVDIDLIAIDPAAGCGDDASAALGAYELLGSTGPDGPFTTLPSTGAFAASDNGTLANAFTGIQPRIRFVRLRALTPQDATGSSGAEYIDVAELHVAKQPNSAVGPSANTGGAQAVGVNSATLTGAVTPHEGTAEVAFEYGTSTAYGSSVNATTLAAGETASAVSVAVGGLQPSTTYHFRAVARRGGNSYPGADATFTTAPAPPPPPTPTPTPSATPTPTPTPDPGPPVTATRFDGTKLSASRKGLFKVRVRFGSRAPAGTARLTVLAGKKRVARGTLMVRAGRASTKTLKLSSTGRRLIKPGKSRKVTLELRLPGGEKVKKTVTLARRKR